MKRIIAFLLISVLGMAMLYCVGQSPRSYEGLEKIVFVTGDSYDTEIEGVDIIQSGSDFYISAPVLIAERVKQGLTNIKGYVLYYNPEIEQDKFLSTIMDYRSPDSTQGDVRVVTGYTNSYSDFRYVDGKKVNVQVAFTEDAIIVGYPLILTGF